MLFHNTLFLSVLFTSVCATSIYPLLAARQTESQCKSECTNLIDQVRSGSCALECICTSSTIAEISACIQCAKAAGETIPGVGPNYIQKVENDCAMAGHPVSGGSSGSSDGLFGTSLGSGASATDFASTATGLGGLGGTAAGGAGPTATSIGKGSGSGSGISFGGSSAMGLTAQIGAVAAAVVSVVILTV